MVEIVLAEQPAAHKPPLLELPGNARGPVAVGVVDEILHAIQVHEGM